MSTIDEYITPAPGGEEDPFGSLFRDVHRTDDGITSARKGEEEPLADLFRDVFDLADEAVERVTDDEIDRSARRVLSAARRKERRFRRPAAAIAAGLLAGAFAAAGSVLLTRILLFLFASFTVVALVTVPSGPGVRHPWIRRLVKQQPRDGRYVLNQALRHLDKIFIKMPGKMPLAPSSVELLMHPGDLASLTRYIDVELVSTVAGEYYAAVIAARAARLDSNGKIRVKVTADPAISAGRYQLRRDQRAAVSPRDRAYAYGHNESTRRDMVGTSSLSAMIDLAVPGDSAVSPPLRLVTNGSIAETRVSGARAGRGESVELRLPEEITVSRVHAEFIFAGDQWWIIGRGRNGLVLNGTPLSEGHVVRPGDSIQWGCQDGALTSRVEIGEEQALYAEKQW